MPTTRTRSSRVAFACTLTTVLMLACALAKAETVYKYRMPNGSVIYSDRPVLGGRLEGELEPPPRPAAGAAPAPRPEPSEAEKRIAARLEALEQARRELDAANAALARAQRRLEAGREPLPHEFQGMAGGGMRLSEGYETRQVANERAVARAQARVDRAVEEVNRLRY